MGEPDRHDVTACAYAWRMLRLAHDRVARRLSGELVHECALTLNEFDVLLYLRTHATREVRVGALLAAVPLSQPALSRLVGRLAVRGLIARAEGADDGRAVTVHLTDAGADLTDRALHVHARVVHETLTGKFTDAEQTRLLRTLSQIGG